MAAYPVTFDIAQPEKFDRVQIAIRIAILVIASFFGWVFGVVWLAIPVAAAIMISQKGPDRYLAESRDDMVKWLRILIAAHAYLGLLTDKLPNEDPTTILRFDIRRSGTPSPGQALLRIFLAIPHYIVLGLLSIVGAVLVIVAAIMILVQESYPAGIFNFLRGLLRWHARLVAYLASLVDEYPPFALDTGSEDPSMQPQAPPEPAP